MFHIRGILLLAENFCQIGVNGNEQEKETKSEPFF